MDIAFGKDALHQRDESVEVDDIVGILVCVEERRQAMGVGPEPAFAAVGKSSHRFGAVLQDERSDLLEKCPVLV